MKLEWYEYTVRAGGRRPSSVGNFRPFSGKMLGIGEKNIEKKDISRRILTLHRVLITVNVQNC